MVRLTGIHLLVFAAAILTPSLGPAAEQPGYSGMVRIADNTYLTVNDRKNPTQSGARLGVLTVTEADGVLFHPLSVKDWRDADREPSDLEACCAIPGRAFEYFLAESGHFNRRFGRIFHVRLSRDAEGSWQAEVLRAFRIYERELDEKGRTQEGEQVEGIACFAAADRTILVYAERGGNVRGAHKLARLVWGEIDLERYQFKKLGDEALVAQSVLGDRDCSDLLVRREKDSWTVYSVATRDSGNVGPFHSVIFRAGTFAVGKETREVRFVREPAPVILYHLHGLKVEALATPPVRLPTSAFSIGTDDESFGGIWRPLFKP